jgi:hypothetical protein
MTRGQTQRVVEEAQVAAEGDQERYHRYLWQRISDVQALSRRLTNGVIPEGSLAEQHVMEARDARDAALGARDDAAANLERVRREALDSVQSRIERLRQLPTPRPSDASARQFVSASSAAIATYLQSSSSVVDSGVLDGDEGPQARDYAARLLEDAKTAAASGRSAQAARLLDRARVFEDYRSGNASQHQQLTLNVVASDVYGLRATAETFAGHQVVLVGNAVGDQPRIAADPYLRFSAKAALLGLAQDAVEALGGRLDIDRFDRDLERTWAIVETAGHFLGGALVQTFEDIDSIWRLVSEPVASAKAMANLALNSNVVWEALKIRLSEIPADIDAMSANERAEIMGRLSSVIVGSMVGGGLIRAGDAASFASVGSEAADRAIRIGARVAQGIEKLGGHSRLAALAGENAADSARLGLAAAGASEHALRYVDEVAQGEPMPVATLVKSLEVLGNVSADGVRVLKEHWNDKAFNHVFMGDFVSGKLVGGMHTLRGLEAMRFARFAHDGKAFIWKRTEHFFPTNLSDELLYREMPNGVIQVHVPYEQFARKKSRRQISMPDGMPVQGLKSLWPESFTADDILLASKATLDANPGVAKGQVTATYRGVQVDATLDDGKITSIYPSAGQ